MNLLHKPYRLFILIFSFLTSTAMHSEYAYRGGSVRFEAQSNNSGFKENRSHSDFSCRNTSDFSYEPHHTTIRASQPKFSKYTTCHDFKDHFTARGYTEKAILDQRFLYMFDEFVKFAQTYSGYKCTIQQLHAELKNLVWRQRAWHWVKGTYCPSLQKRIHFLYNQLDTIKAVQPSNNNNVPYCNLDGSINNYVTPTIKAVESSKHTEPVPKNISSTFRDQIAEYNTLDSTYRTHTPSLSNAISKRLVTYNGMSVSDASRYTNQTYVFNDNVKQLLSKHGQDAKQFDACFGNSLDHVIHQESIDILERVDRLLPDSMLYSHQGALVDFTAAMVSYNHEGMTDKATQIGDLCWTLLDFGQAVAEGAVLGVYSAATDIINHPIQAGISIIASKPLLAYQLSKVIYNVADIGITAVTNWSNAKDKWHKYTEPINNIISAISKKEISLRDAVKGGTRFAVGLYAQSKLLGGLGKFCNTIRQKSINFIQKSPLLKPQEYLATPEGLLLKATNNIKPSGKTNTASNVKNAVERKIATKSVLISSTIASKGIIRNVTEDLRSTIKKYEGHIFSKEHIQDGIMALGKDQETIMNSLYNVIMSIDKKGLLQEGSNQMRVMINGISNVEIRCCIQKGEVISANAFISDFNRIFSNFIDMTKV